ncbi:MAG TPA: M17 family peptidase N-terminal domain-containing protein [Thermoanaerobaculia bacterium]|nr:M17 family peptidase N-terminal domain-containing protein [Thermoanaerobaculia bacterium]
MTERPRLSIVAPGEGAGGPLDDLGAADLVLVAAFEGEAPRREELPEPVAAAVERAAARPGWTGRDGQRVEAETEGRGPMVALHGLGARGEASRRKLDNWLRSALETAAKSGARRATVVLPDCRAGRGAGATSWVARALVRGTYRFDRFQGRNGQDRPRLDAVRVVPPESGSDDFRDAAPVLAAVSDAVSFCRDLANTPPNEATPEWMAERAREMAGEHGLDAQVLEPEEIARRGMGALLAVGAGSRNRPRLVRLEKPGPGPVVALVGKGVTFDTGGISIKPATDMDDMKYDKAGACAVLAAARAVAQLELPVHLRVYTPLAENMPDGESYRPGDIVRCYNGKTVEVINTDAEGRLILADALALAAEEGADYIVELSTLTGACVVALGTDAAGLYTPDDPLAAALLAAADDTGERLWRLPLWPEFVERMKANHADLKNAAGRWGGANAAAAFLSCFVGDHRRWAHLDIAGGAHVGRDGDETPGATGYGVALLVEWLRRLAS